MKKGFATSAILYTILLLFIVLLVGILNNLQNKKVILDALKEDTVNALNQDVVTDAILEQITIINNKLAELENKIENTKEEANKLRLQYKQVVIDNVTINNEGYARIAVPEDVNFLFVTLVDWSNTSSPIAIHGTGKNAYLSGTPDVTIRRIVVRFWYYG